MGIDFNFAPKQDEVNCSRINAADIRSRLSANVESFLKWLFQGRALIKRGEARIGNVMGEPGKSLAIALAKGTLSHFRSRLTVFLGLETTRRLPLWCYWRYALREHGLDLLTVAARDPAADAELIPEARQKSLWHTKVTNN